MSGYPQVGTDGDGRPVVELDADHPGAADPVYRARRDAIAALAIDWCPGDPVPHVDYSAQEHATWREVRTKLGPLWQSSACRSFLDGVEALGLPTERVPQLDEVSAALAPLTGWSYRPVAGLAPLRTFYGAFGEATFWSTQYLRHHSRPLYTPEPDLCHEVLGHAHQLADPALCGLYRAVAAATARVETPEALSFLSRVFWRTVEFGVVRENGRVHAWGAGLLSSYGELQVFRHADILDIDLDAMGTRPYDITRYQTELYAAPSMGWVTGELVSWVEAYDDDTCRRAADGQLDGLMASRSITNTSVEFGGIRGGEPAAP